MYIYLNNFDISNQILISLFNLTKALGQAFVWGNLLRNSAWANSIKEGVVNYKSPSCEIQNFELSPSSNLKEGVEL